MKTGTPVSYECITIQGLSYPSVGCRPPRLYEYPKVSPPVKLLFLGWNPPKPFGGFWSINNRDNLRGELHALLKKLGQIHSSISEKDFLDEFLAKGFYFIHTVKCWTEAKFPGIGRRVTSKERKEVGIPLINACVLTHLAKELEVIAPQKVCALGEVPFLGLRELFPALAQASATPTEGKVFQREQYGIPWPILYTCFPQRQTMFVRGTKCRQQARELVLDHLRVFLQAD